MRRSGAARCLTAFLPFMIIGVKGIVLGQVVRAPRPTLPDAHDEGTNHPVDICQPEPTHSFRTMRVHVAWLASAHFRHTVGGRW